MVMDNNHTGVSDKGDEVEQEIEQIAKDLCLVKRANTYHWKQFSGMARVLYAMGYTRANQSAATELDKSYVKLINAIDNMVPVAKSAPIETSGYITENPRLNEQTLEPLDRTELIDFMISEEQSWSDDAEFGPGSLSVDSMLRHIAVRICQKFGAPKVESVRVSEAEIMEIIVQNEFNTEKERKHYISPHEYNKLAKAITTFVNNAVGVSNDQRKDA